MAVNVIKVENLKKEDTGCNQSVEMPHREKKNSRSKRRQSTAFEPIASLFCKGRREPSIPEAPKFGVQSSSDFTFNNYDMEKLTCPSLPYITTNVITPVRLRTDVTDTKAVTICDLLQQTIRASDTSEYAIAHQPSVDGEWSYITYPKYYSMIKDVSRSLLALGVREGEGVAIIGFNHVCWHLSYMGAIHIGAIGVGIYTTNNAETNLANFQLANCTVIIVDTEAQMEKLDLVKSQIKNLRAVVAYNLNKSYKLEENEYTWNKFIEFGKKDEAALTVTFDERVSELAPNKCCSIVFTSGTTGNPKAAMLSHDNLVWTAKRFVDDYGPIYGAERILSYLPLSHVAAQCLDIAGPIVTRSTVYYAQPSALKGTLKITLNQVKPTIFLGVPRVFEKIHERIVEAALANGYLKRKIGHWAKNVGFKYGMKMINKTLKKDPLSYKLANSLVYKKVKAVLGLDKCRYMFFGAAPMHETTMDFFLSLGMYIHGTYGMSETSGPQTLMLPTEFNSRTVGKPYSGTHIRINDADSEVQMYGRNIFMGYKDNTEKTVEGFTDDYYLKSGDQGKWEDDHLQIIGRIKDLIITAGGENISTGNIENAIRKQLKCLSNIIIVGDKRKYLIALLTLKVDLLETGLPSNKLSLESLNFCQESGSDTCTIEPISTKQDKKIVDAIQAAIDRANKHAINQPHKVQKWAVLEKDFSILSGELGPTLKTKKHIIYDKYDDVIEALYG